MKLSEKQKEVIKLLLNGWDLYGQQFYKKTVHKFSPRTSTIKSLYRKSILRQVYPNRSLLTELGRTLWLNESIKQ